MTTFPITQQAGSLLKSLVNAVLPPICIGCQQPVTEIGNLCPDCFVDITFVSDPVCTLCGLPFQIPTEPNTLCAGCIAARPAFSRARAATIYGGKARDIILALKHGDRTDSAPHLAHWLVRAGRGLIDTDTIFTAIPLHASRLRHRKYNQAGLLANAVAHHTDRHVFNNMLTRTRRTKPQGGLTKNGRLRNVTGAFQVTETHRHDVDGARIILIDDVMTTGATVEAAARTLYRAGAQDVAVLTLARVVITG